MPEFQLAVPGERWPSGDYANVAVLDIDEADLTRALATNLLIGDEEGLGPWKAVGFRLRDGAMVEIIEYEGSPQKGFGLRVDRGADAEAALQSVLRLLGKDEACITWKRS